jgi:hypothetical protein
VHRTTALALVLLAACHSGPRGGVDQPGAPTPALAVERFLTAARAQDLQGLAMAWGTEKGPARDVVDRKQIERRELIMICYLNHDTYRVKSEAPAPEGRRAFTVELKRGPVNRTSTFTTVKGPAERFYVEQVALAPLADLCASGGPAQSPPR